MMTVTTDVKSFGLVKFALCAFVLYAAYKIIQRLFFHPLAKVPGPWYAAVSTLYEFYWDCPRSGKYFKKIEEMHKKYGNCLSPYTISSFTRVHFSLNLANSAQDLSSELIPGKFTSMTLLS